MIIIIVIFGLFFLIPFMAGLFGVKPPNSAEQTEQTEREELSAIHKQERIDIMDNTLVQYIKLMDSLAAQLKTETDEKKRSVLLAKQITTNEKYTKALEKREKLDN